MPVLDTPADPDASVLRLTGDAHFGTLEAIGAALAARVEEGSGAVVVDLGAVEFLDSTVVALLLRVQRRLADQGRRLTVVAPRSPAGQLLELTGTAQALGARA